MKADGTNHTPEESKALREQQAKAEAAELREGIMRRHEQDAAIAEAGQKAFLKMINEGTFFDTLRSWASKVS